MANKKVLTKASNCACGCETDGDNGSIPIVSPQDQIVVRNRPGIEIGNVINEYNENGVKIYELDDLDLVGPGVTLTNDAPDPVEVGRTIAAVVFNGSIVQGTFPIIQRTISPDPGGLNLLLPFTFTVNNVKRNTPGAAAVYTLTAKDEQLNTSQVVKGVNVKHAAYHGFNAAAILNETQIKALTKTIVDSVLDSYGGTRQYVVPGPDPKYIYWCGVQGTPIIGGATLSGFALPLIDVGPVSVQNIYDSSLVNTYWVKRTANKFDPGTYSIFLS